MHKTETENLEAILRSGQVARYHAQPEIPAQSMAEHQWGVAILVIKMYSNPSKNLLMAAVTHDCAEAVTGDIPSPVKREHPEMKAVLDDVENRVNKEWGINYDLNEIDKRRLKICDILEGLYYSAQSVRRNHEAHHVVVSWLDYLMAYNINKEQIAFINECVKGTGIVHERMF